MIPRRNRKRKGRMLTPRLLLPPQLASGEPCERFGRGVEASQLRPTAAEQRRFQKRSRWTTNRACHLVSTSYF